MLLNQKSLTVTSADAIKNLCASLATQLDLNFFDYVRVYNDNSGFVLSNRLDIIEYLFTHQYRIIETVPTHLIKDKFHYLLMPQGAHERLLWEVKLLFNITYPLDIIERHKDYCELFCFSNTLGTRDVINVYLNNMDKLEQFIKDFKKDAASLLRNGHHDKINFPTNMLPNFRGTDLGILDDVSVSIKSTTESSQLNSARSLFTAREIDCMRTLTTTYSIKKCALKLNLSPRTVESYLNNIKSKLGIASKAKLLDYINDNYSTM